MQRAISLDTSVGRIVLAVAFVHATACASLATKAEARGADAVTEWTLIADCYGNGAANWRTLAIMHVAMHDALNAVDSVYARWSPPSPGEPPPVGANAAVAMASAADAVLTLLHPDRASETARAFATVLARYPDDAGKAAGRALGAAIGRAAVERRAGDGFDEVRYFTGDEGPGRWRPTPNLFQTSRTNDSRPFLFDAVAAVPTLPPPARGTALYLEQLAETRRLGGLLASERTPEQTNDAYFWAYQSSQRGFVDLAVRLLAARRPKAGLNAEARIMAQLTAALADSAILTWHEKAQYAAWRPVTAIRADGGDFTWQALIETPPFPEYPSGHATDCYTGAGVLEAAFPDLEGPVVYESSAYMQPLTAPTAAPVDLGMGQHAQWAGEEAPGGTERRFASLAAAAENCARSRIWAGAHFAAAEAESERLAGVIVRKARAAAPSVLAPRDGPRSDLSAGIGPIGRSVSASSAGAERDVGVAAVLAFRTLLPTTYARFGYLGLDLVYPAYSHQYGRSHHLWDASPWQLHRQ
jgi:hypothetical protein